LCVGGRPPFERAASDAGDGCITASDHAIGRVQKWTLRVHFVPVDAPLCLL
jgi:hypothetical protein